MPASLNTSISNATFNDGSLSTTQSNSLGLSQVALTNNSAIVGSPINNYIGNATLDNSSIIGNGAGTITGMVTLSDVAYLSFPNETLSGTLSLLAGTNNLSAGMAMQNGTLSIELNGQVSDPIIRPITQSNGTLDFTLQNGFEPSIGEQFAIFNPSIGNPLKMGTFATINVPSLPAGESWDVSSFYTTGTITVVPEPIRRESWRLQCSD